MRKHEQDWILPILRDIPAFLVDEAVSAESTHQSVWVLWIVIASLDLSLRHAVDSACCEYPLLNIRNLTHLEDYVFAAETAHAAAPAFADSRDRSQSLSHRVRDRQLEAVANRKVG